METALTIDEIYRELKLMHGRAYEPSKNIQPDPQNACAYLIVTHTLIKEGNFFQALDVINMGVGYYKEEVALNEPLIMLLCEKAKLYQKIGYTDEALALLKSVELHHPDQQEIAGLLGSCYKAIALSSKDTQLANHHFELSISHYQKALYMLGDEVNEGNYWHAINICTLSFLRKNKNKFIELYQPLKVFLEQQLQCISPAPWIVATMAEAKMLAHLVLGEFSEEEVKQAYLNIIGLDDFFVLQSCMNNLMAILNSKSADIAFENRVYQWFPGTMVVKLYDRYDFDNELHQLITHIKDGNYFQIKLAALPTEQNKSFVLALQNNLEHSINCLWLSLCEDAVTIDNMPGEHWTLHRSNVAINEALLDYWDSTLTGLSRWMECAQINTQYKVIGNMPTRQGASALFAHPRTEVQINDHLRTIIVADAAGFSKLNDEQVKIFFEVFLQKIRDVSRTYDAFIEQREGWGDAILFIFNDVSAGLNCGLDIIDLVNTLNRENTLLSMGLPSELTMRMAIESAPLSKVYDPIEDKHSYTGTFISRAARIEPITQKGEVYCSLGCAMLARDEGVEGIDFQYMGVTKLSKKYGQEHVFRIFRK